MKPSLMDISELDVILLCGGLGARLRSVTNELPKVMVEVEGEPFLNFIIRHLKSQGVERVILCTGYQAQVVENYYRKNDFEIVIDYSREETPLGTGGAIKNAREIIDSDEFFVLNGDCFCPVELKDMLKFHYQKKALATIAAHRIENADEFGTLEIKENKGIASFKEKMKGVINQYANAGVYCFNKEILNLFPEKDKFSLEVDVFPEMVNAKLFAFLTEKEFLDIGTPDRLQKAINLLKK